MQVKHKRVKTTEAQIPRVHAKHCPRRAPMPSKVKSAPLRPNIQPEIYRMPNRSAISHLPIQDYKYQSCRSILLSLSYQDRQTISLPLLSASPHSRCHSHCHSQLDKLTTA